MKYICLIPIFFPLITALPVLRGTEFLSCDFNWVLTNVVVNCTNDTRTIEAIITFGESTNSTVYPMNNSSSSVYQIRVIIHDCGNQTANCTDEPIATVNSINCDPNPPPEAVEPCIIAQEMGQLKMQEQMIGARYGWLVWPLFCIEADSIDWDDNCPE